MADFLHHTMTRERRRCHIRQLCLGGDQIPAYLREQRGITAERMTDIRDTAWTARDLVSMSEPWRREAFWWEQRWPHTTWGGWRDPFNFGEETA